MYFAILEFLGTTELLVVLVVALIIFGPRKLPEIGRSLGRAMSELRRTSDDFKRTWEAEAAVVEAPRPAEAIKEATSAPEAIPASPEQPV
jgi:TatA/E family protein of Tat protein translocase